MRLFEDWVVGERHDVGFFAAALDGDVDGRPLADLGVNVRRDHHDQVGGVEVLLYSITKGNV